MRGGARCVFGIVLVIWSLGPIYNMVMVALDAHDDVFSSHVFPPSTRP